MSNKKKDILILIILVFFITIVANAATILYTANNVTFSSSSLNGNNVQSAYDNLYNKCLTAKTTCPSGMTCTTKTNIKCRRASSLHTETCSQTDTSRYCIGAGFSYGETLTYGNRSYTEGVLAVGDAFDCNVDGTGYNKRFYYISDYFDTSSIGYNNDVAVLVYYSNTIAGVDSTLDSVYASRNDTSALGCSSSCAKYGPITGVHDLPTTSQWSNIRLYKTSRQLISEKNNTTVNGNTFSVFDYSSYSARILTAQEFYYNCFDYSSNTIKIHNKCLFMYERTNFANPSITSNGAGFENPRNVNYPSEFLGLYSELNTTMAQYIWNEFAVRPVIEIPKSQISY